MAVPSQSELNRPLVEIAASKSEQLTARQFRDEIASRLSLTDEDVQERTSTNASKLMTKMGFALSDLARGGLLDRPEKGSYVISKAGRELLQLHTGRIGPSMLNALIKQKRTGVVQPLPPPTDESESEEDPDKKMEDGYRVIRANLEGKILDSLLGMLPDGFERLALTLLEALGYGKGDVVGRSGDDGIDVIINQDALGLEKVYVQAKRWRQSVGGPVIREFSGSLQLRGAAKGVFVTTSHFTSSAKETAEKISQTNQTILLIDGQKLASLMFDRDVGVITEQTYAIKKLDENYFAEV